VPWGPPRGVGVVASQVVSRTAATGTAGLELPRSRRKRRRPCSTSCGRPTSCPKFRQVAMMDAAGRDGAVDGRRLHPARRERRRRELVRAREHACGRRLGSPMGEAFTSATGFAGAAAAGGARRRRGGRRRLPRPRRRRDRRRLGGRRALGTGGRPPRRGRRGLPRPAAALAPARRGLPACQPGHIPRDPALARTGCRRGYIRFLDILDAGGAAATGPRARNLLDELVAEQPMWREAFKRFRAAP